MGKNAITLQELAKLTGSLPIGSLDFKIEGVAGLEYAKGDQVSFLSNERYLPLMETTLAGVVFVSPQYPKKEGRNYLVHKNPALAFQKAVEIYQKRAKPKSTSFLGIHPMSVVHPQADLEQQVTVGPHTVIDADVSIGAKTHIGANCTIGPHVKIGEECFIHPNVVIREGTQIGSRVTIQPGAVIGSCGFGFSTDEQGHHHKFEHIGYVVIEDDVEIGANTCIDRAVFDKTVIGRGTKIDNLVQIGHNVQVGKHCLLCGQVGIAGSTKIGDHVILSGQVGVKDHITVADRVIVGACSALSKSITESGEYAGVPAVPAKDFRKSTVLIRQLGKIYDLLKELSKKVSDLEKVKSKPD